MTHKTIFALVSRGASPDRIYREAVHECPVISGLLAPAELVTPLCVEQDSEERRLPPLCNKKTLEPVLPEEGEPKDDNLFAALRRRSRPL